MSDKLAQVVAYMQRSPTASRRQVTIACSVSTATLKGWENAGHVVFDDKAIKQRQRTFKI